MNLISITMDHAKLIFDWRNDPRVYEYLFNPGTVEWENHLAWLEKTIANEKVWFYLALEDDVPMGTVRFDMVEGTDYAEVGIYVDPNKKSKGLGSKILLAGEKKFKEETGIAKIMAQVLTKNEASLGLFKKNNYQESHVVFFKDIE